MSPCAGKWLTHTLECIPEYVEVAQHRQNESMMNSNVVGENSLQLRNNCATNDCRHSSPEAFPVNGPKPAMARVKMLGNMIELNKPTAIIVHMAKEPKLSIESVTSSAATAALKPSRARVGSFCSTPDPTKRPTIAPPQ